MTDVSVTLSRVRYAPEVPGFSALAHVTEAGVAYRYPVQMAAPLTAEFDTIARALTRRGLSAHRNVSGAGLRMVEREQGAGASGPAMPSPGLAA
ncbi:hypothetical protein FDP25_07925 [Roseovarius sp. A21]|uniref:Uncharacterized protein n=1 Tax=Roseovarius bejariae TaxID=2576383 RepID=A0A844CL32_9RHOB|nr:hypothetical protein [Roseovarius bejariae]MRU15352.1 hypothetical protein [Roseovarius bejariae]